MKNEDQGENLEYAAGELKSFDPIAETLEAAAKHGYSVTLTMYLSPPEPMEGRIPAGDPPSTSCGFSEVAAPAARMAMAAEPPAPHSPPRFVLNDFAKFIHRGFPVEAEVRAVSTYVDREAAYLLRPYRANDQQQLGHDHDVWKDEGELERI